MQQYFIAFLKSGPNRSQNEEEAQQLADQIKLFEDFAKEAGEEILQSIVAEGEQRKEVEQMIQADVAEEAAMAAAAAKKSSEGQK